MKSYDRLVFWLNYFDSELKTREGRRVPLNSCVRSPSLEELALACQRLHLEPNAQPAHYPSRPERGSGYVSVVKNGQKQKVLLSIAKELSKIRGEKASNPRKV